MFAPLYRLPLAHPVVHGCAVVGFCCIPQVVSVFFSPSLILFFCLFISYF